MAKKQLREFGLLIGFGFPIFIGWIIPAFVGHTFRIWTLWIAIPTLILGLLRPSSLQFPYKAWMFIGHTLGWINSRIILGLIFVFVLLPISLIMRLFGYDPLNLEKRNLKTYKQVKPDNIIDLKRIF